MFGGAVLCFGQFGVSGEVVGHKLVTVLYLFCLDLSSMFVSTVLIWCCFSCLMKELVFTNNPLSKQV